ncbi:hypothetical protein [Streptosporangium carneum]|uniref:hypothetical protein n=1 Tax=Streptosporangium carneum TaxID=47481 RepID=UPI0022F2C533|nr:hypothetical protein [Streptosporangium carneum]
MFAGIIQDDGLANSAERLAYVRPKVDDRRDWFGVTRIGSARSALMGDSRNRVPIGQFIATISITLGGAAMVLLIIAARCGSTVRDRRTRLLTALGGGYRHRALVNLGEALIPSSVGTVLGCVPYFVMTIWNVRLPITGFTTNSADLRSWAWAAPTAAVSAFALALLVVVTIHRDTGSTQGTQPRTFEGAIPRWRSVVGAIGLIAIVVTPYLSKVMSFLAYVGGTALLWGMLPSTAGLVIRRLGTSLANFGVRTGRSDTLIAGRWAHARPGVVVRLVSVVVIGLGVITQAQVWSSRLGESGQNAQRAHQELRDSVLIVVPQSMTPLRVDRFTGLLPKEAELLMVNTPDTPEGTTEIRGSCSTVRKLNLKCSPGPLAQDKGDVRARFLNQYVSYVGKTELREGSVLAAAKTSDRIAVILPLGSDGFSGQVKQAAYQSFGMAFVERPYDSWLLGTDNLATMATWVRLFTVLMMGILLLAVVTSSAGEFLTFTTAVAPLAVLTERRRFVMGIALWNLSAPTVIAVGFGTAVAAWQGTFFIAMTSAGTFSWTLLGTSALVALGLAGVIGLAGGLGAVQATAQWRPAAD